MSDTPRTDSETISGSEQIAYLDENGLRCTTYHFVTVDFARTLERENAELRAEVEEYAMTVSHMRDGARLQNSATAAVMERNEKAARAVEAQCRLLAMGSEREARLMARVAELDKANVGLAQESHDLQQICRDAYEVWAGSEGIPVPQTFVEEYLLQLLEQMRDEVKGGLK